jgi:hypothetical protein
MRSTYYVFVLAGLRNVACQQLTAQKRNLDPNNEPELAVLAALFVFFSSQSPPPSKLRHNPIAALSQCSAA